MELHIFYVLFLVAGHLHIMFHVAHSAGLGDMDRIKYNIMLYNIFDQRPQRLYLSIL